MKEFEDELIQPDKIFFFPNGNILAFSKEGLQITPLQMIDFYSMFFSFLDRNGLDPTKCTYYTYSNQEIEAINDNGRWTYKNK